MRILFILLTVTPLIAQISAEPFSNKEANPSTPIWLTGLWELCKTNLDKPVLPIESCSNTMQIPGTWETQGHEDYDGYALLQKSFLWNQKTVNGLGIYINQIRDSDEVYINGQLIGATGQFLPDFRKATIYSRLYPIPDGLLKPNQNNLISIIVYNNARPGGIPGQAPVIDNYLALNQKQQINHYETVFFTTLLLVFTLMHLVHFCFHPKSTRESFYYAIFTFSWALYLMTYSELILETEWNLNLIFQLNVILFYIIFVTLPAFVYRFFDKPLPKPLKAIFTLVFANILFVALTSRLELVYWSLKFVESFILIATLPFAIHVLFRAVKEKLDYAKIMTFLLAIYMVTGVYDIFIDYTQGITDMFDRLLGPYGLVVLTIGLSMVLSHKHSLYFQGATYDHLTGLLQRKPFVKKLSKAILSPLSNDQKLIVVMIDLDNFKQINDQYGHFSGDKILIAAAEALKSSIRPSDNICRFGGDEFCVSAIVKKSDDTDKYVRRMHSALHAVREKIGHQWISPQATFGVIAYQNSFGTNPEHIITLADNQLIKAKTESKGSIAWLNNQAA